MKRVLLTGAAGFVGSHVLRHILMETDWEVVCPVTFRHKGIPPRIHSALDSVTGAAARVSTVILDLTAPVDPITTAQLGRIDVIMNVASNSHVDRSLERPVPFVLDNVAIMLNTLELARVLHPFMFLQMSTDEVYGPAPAGYDSVEWDPIVPSNPYSASKAAQEAVAISYWRSYGVPLVITNTMNVIGEMQDPEKFVPMIIRKVLAGDPVPVHCAPDGTAGSRFYLHARNLADAWVMLAGSQSDPVERYADGATRPARYSVVGELELGNDELVTMIADILGRPAFIDRQTFHATRPGHDLRYALDGSKIWERFGWSPPVPLRDSLKRTVEWTLAHPEWLEL